MINLMLLACIGCGPANKVGYGDQVAKPVPLSEQWSCNEFSWSAQSPTDSIVRINVHDCQTKDVSVHVSKNNSKHLHYNLNKASDCEWKIMLILDNITCKEIEDISIVQKY